MTWEQAIALSLFSFAFAAVWALVTEGLKRTIRVLIKVKRRCARRYGE